MASRRSSGGGGEGSSLFDWNGQYVWKPAPNIQEKNFDDKIFDTGNLFNTGVRKNQGIFNVDTTLGNHTSALV